MNTRLQLKMMAGALRKSGVRSLLALAAVGFAIASLMVTFALSAGARMELQAISDRMGKNLFVIRAGQVPVSPARGTGWFTSTKLKQSDAAALRAQVRGIVAIVPVLEGNCQARLHREALNTTLRGVTPEFLEVRNFRLADGRSIDDQDGARQSRVAVVGPFVARKLNDGASMVGETVWLGGVPFRVVGQLREKGISDGQNEDDQILIPVETAQRRIFNVEYLSRLLVQVADQGRMREVQGEARELLRRSHALDAATEDDFEVLDLIRADAIKKLNAAFLTGLSRLFAAITLVIGGAGVLAVTYLNVKDRTWEIGLRMAVGARRRDITRLFVAEACVLSVLGGVAGILMGWGGIAGLRQVTAWHMAVELRGVLIPFAVAVLVGLGFSVAPALKAAKVAPVQALRGS